MPDFDRVVRTKIVPPTRRVGLLRRPRLIDFLHEHVNRKLLLISAAAGYGKTSLLIDFLQDTELPACWYSMDDGDADPRTFVAHLAASIAERFPELESVSGQVDSGGPQALMRALVNRIQADIHDYFLVVIDDFQFISGSQSVGELVNWFLEYQPDNCCIVLASRTIPDLPYLKLAANQEIEGLGSEDLAFTPQEIRDYLDLNHKLRIPPEEAERLAKQTEGWITGILLSTHTLWKGLLRNLTGSSEQVFDYLAEEVFADQPRNVQDFLKSTSILDRMSPRFCDALLNIDDSESILEDLHKANLFVTLLSGERKTYRYHALFQEFLQGQFGKDESAHKAGLHHRAAKLLEQDGKVEEAIEHFLLGQSDQEALRLIKSVMEAAYQSGRHVTLARWLDQLSRQLLESDGEACVMRGRVWRQEAEFGRALDWYQRAHAVYEKSGDQAGQSEALVREGMIHRYRGELDEARQASERVLEMPRSSAGATALAHRILGECHHLAGDLPSAKEQFRLALKLNRKVGNDYDSALLLHALGTTARRMGNSIEADGHYRQALQLMEKIGNRWRVAEIKNNLGVGLYYQGDYQQAQQVLREALDEARQVGHVYTEALIMASLGDVLFELGEFSPAHFHFQNSLSGARESGDVALEVYVLCALANLYRIDKAWDQSHGLLLEAESASSARQSGYLQGLIALTRGMVLVAEGKSEQAGTDLAGAVELLEKAGARRELARAQLWLAFVYYQTARREQALDRLKLAVRIAEEISHSHLLVQDGRRTLPMLEWAAAAGVEHLEPLLARIRQFTLTTLRRSEETVGQRQPRLEIRGFGEGSVIINGEAVPHKSWGGPLVKELFFYLLENGPARREAILGTFWPDYSTAKAKSIFHASLYRMRRVLPEDAILYLREADQYRFNQEIDCWYDVLAFERLLSEAAENGPNAEEMMGQALSIYQGDFLRDVYSDWCLERRHQLQRMYVDALTGLAEIKHRNSDDRRAADLYQAALEEEPYREDLLRELMDSMIRAGQSAQAVKRFNQFSERLRREGIPGPTEETLSLLNAIHQQSDKSD